MRKSSSKSATSPTWGMNPWNVWKLWTAWLIALALWVGWWEIKNSVSWNTQESTMTVDKVEDNTTHTLQDNAHVHGEDSIRKIHSIIETDTSISPQLKDTITNAITSNNPDTIADTIQAITEHIGDHSNHGESHGNQTMIMILSLLTTVWFAWMIVWAARWKPISFVRHHAIFAWLTAIMATQMPHEILHWLIESAIAFVAIFGITRLSRWITNKVDFEKLDGEEAKTVLWFLWPIASIITTPAAAWVFAKMKNNMNEDEKYISMQTLGNVDGWIAIGDFPFLYNWMKNGPWMGTLRQTGVMWPIMIFHKLYQAILRKVWPKKLVKARPQIMQILKWFRFDKTRLGHSASIDAEELAQAKEFLEYLKWRVKEIKDLDSHHHKLLDEVIGQTDKEIWEQIVSAQIPWNDLWFSVEGMDHIKTVDDFQNLEKFTQELENVLTHPETSKDISIIVEEVRRAISDGHISPEEVQQFMHGDYSNTNTVVAKLPWLQWAIEKLEQRVDGIFNILMRKLYANHNEVEISRVFTAQALAISLLIPAFSSLLSTVPEALEWLDAGFSSVADNYAATAVTWVADNAKSIAFAILWWALSIYGNMANLNFLGKDGNFAKSLKMAKYMIPTLMFTYGRFNSDKVINMFQSSSPSPMTVNEKDNDGDIFWSDTKITAQEIDSLRALGQIHTLNWDDFGSH